MNFSDKPVAMDSFKAGEECVEMGSRKCKVFSIVDVDSTGLPSLVRPFTNIEVNNTEMPVDLVSMIDSIPDARTVVYNQMIFMQARRKSLPHWKRRRTAMPASPIHRT